MNHIRKRRQCLRQVEANKRNIIIIVLLYCFISVILYIVILYIIVKEFGLWAALAVTAVNYPYIVMAIGAILRMRGDITERGFIRLVLEGFKTTSMFKRIGEDSVDVRPTRSPSSKKS